MRILLAAALLAACSKSAAPKPKPVLGSPEDVAQYAAELSKTTGMPMHGDKTGIIIDAPTCSFGLIKQLTTAHDVALELNAHGVTEVSCAQGVSVVSGPWTEK